MFILSLRIVFQTFFRYFYKSAIAKYLHHFALALNAVALCKDTAVTVCRVLCRRIGIYRQRLLILSEHAQKQIRLPIDDHPKYKEYQDWQTLRNVIEDHHRHCVHYLSLIHI